MNNKFKKTLSLFLCVITVLSVLSASITSVYALYENTHANTGNGAEDIIAVATTQLGYHEGNSSSQIDGSGTGTGNYTKYGKWYGINPGAWCAMFVSWCANQAGISTGVIPKHASCDVGMNWFKNKGRWQYSKYFGGNYTPKRGDIIYFGSNPNNLNDSTHVGIVTGADSAKVYTIEGNSASQCRNCSYSLGDDYIFGYGLPNYAVTAESEYKTGTYVITASNLNMRSQPNTSGSIVAVLKAGDCVEITSVSGKWGYTSFGTKSGWISLAYASSVNAMRYTVSDNGIAFLKSVEGYSKYAYWDNSQWSIGYGTGCGENDYSNGITESEAEALLRSAVIRYEVWLNTFLYDNNIDLNQNQYDSLVSFTYNLGNIWSSSFTLKTYLINGINNYTDSQIISAFGEKVYVSGNVNQGLVNRRNKEAALFLTKEEEESDTEERSDTYKVVYNANSGSNAPNADTKIQGETLTLTTSVPTRNGYVFLGWSETSTGKVAYGVGDKFTKDSNTTLYAVWGENPLGGNRSFIITATSLNIRNLATTTNSTVLGSIPNGAIVTAVSYYKNGEIVNSVSDTSGAWGYVTYNGITGWISLSSSYSKEVYGVFYNVIKGNITVDAQIKLKGDTLILSDVIPTNGNAVFLGWSPDASASVATYKAGSEYKAEEYAFLYDVWHTEHSFVTATVEPTCTENGSTAKICNICGYSEKDEISSLGHSFENSTVNPTCTEKGYKVYKCTRCTYSYIDN